MLGKIYSLAKRLLGAFLGDESEEVTEEIIRLGAFSWTTDTYSQSPKASPINYDLSMLSINPPSSSPKTSDISYPSLSTDILKLSESLMEEARRYPMDFTREELY